VTAKGNDLGVVITEWPRRNGVRGAQPAEAAVRRCEQKKNFASKQRHGRSATLTGQPGRHHG